MNVGSCSENDGSETEEKKEEGERAGVTTTAIY